MDVFVVNILLLTAIGQIHSPIILIVAVQMTHN